MSRVVLIGTGSAPKPVSSGGINHSYGLCGCWLCKGQRVPLAEQSWMLDTLARDLLRKDDEDRALWLTHWTHRHGGGAASRLRKHVLDVQRRIEHLKEDDHVVIS